MLRKENNIDSAQLNTMLNHFDGVRDRVLKSESRDMHPLIMCTLQRQSEILLKSDIENEKFKMKISSVDNDPE